MYADIKSQAAGNRKWKVSCYKAELLLVGGRTEGGSIKFKI